jgi:hypothetical protein
LGGCCSGSRCSWGTGRSPGAGGPPRPWRPDLRQPAPTNGRPRCTPAWSASHRRHKTSSPGAGPPRTLRTPLRCLNSASGLASPAWPPRPPPRAPTPGPVQHRVRVGATAIEDPDDGGGTLGVGVDKVGLTAARRPLTACSDGAWNNQLGRLVPQQQRSAAIGGQLVGPDVHGRLAHALAAGREVDVGPNAGARSARSGRGSTPQRALSGPRQRRPWSGDRDHGERGYRSARLEQLTTGQSGPLVARMACSASVPT